MVTEMGEEDGEGSGSGQMGGVGEVGGNGGIGEVGETDRVGKTDGAGAVRAMGGEMAGEMGGLGGSGAPTSLAVASGARTVQSRGGDEAAEAAEAAESAEAAEAAEAAELRAALARLRLRERQLCERLEARRSAAQGSPFLARPPDSPAAGVGPGGGVRRGPFARRRIWPGERKTKSVHRVTELGYTRPRRRHKTCRHVARLASVAEARPLRALWL